jgi:hypothetical protein
MPRKLEAYFLVMCLALVIACALSVPASPTVEPTAEALATGQVLTQVAEQAVATRAQATEVAESNATATEAAKRTQSFLDLQTAHATSTALKMGFSTEAARPMVERVAQLYDEGYISRTGGVYSRLDTFDERWAQINWYQFWYTDYSPSDFVLRADASWDSASDKANWYDSGCGFVFRATDKDNHYMAFLALDGRVNFSRIVKGRPTWLGSGYYGVLDVPSGKAELMLVVEGSTFTFFVNGKKVHSRQDTALSSGSLALTLVSGTNKGYGTHCRMTNIDLWELE